jgi:Tfp pilus assembly protein PilF
LQSEDILVISFPSQKAASATAVENALWLHRSGRLQEAESIYRQVLDTSPSNFDALHLLGVLSHQIGDHQQAVKLIEKATRINKKNPAAFNHLGAAYRALGRQAEAEKAYRTALRIQPDFPEAYFNLGNALADLKRLKEAERAYRSALKQKSDYSAAYNNLGNVLKDLGRPDEAEVACTRALEFDPDFAEAYCNLAFILLDLNRADEAECALKKALAIRPDHSETSFQLGVTLVKCGKFDEAAQVFSRVTELQPDYAEAFLNLGNTRYELKHFEEAVRAYLHAIDLKPELAETYNNLGNTLTELERLEEAEVVYRKAVALKPEYADACYNHGNALRDLGRMEEAEAAYCQSLTLKPDDATTQWNLGLLKLVQGDLDHGLKLHERRFDRATNNELEATIKILDQLPGESRWQGEPLDGTSLLVITEQGAGDNLMMMRYLPLLRQRGLKRLVLYCYPQLMRVMFCMPGIDQIVPITDPLPFGDFDLYCPIMSLPYLFQTRLESIPANVPYLVVPEEMKQKWHMRLAEVPGLKVGLVWAGNQAASFDKIRSIPLNLFAPLHDSGGISFVSLQKGDRLQQLHKFEGQLIDWMDECKDYLDTAALVEQLDLIISVDTSVAHLAGALGKPVWLLNRFESEWRWMLDREDSPWYPSMRIFTQPVRNDWDSVVKRVGEELAVLLKEKSRSFL